MDLRVSRCFIAVDDLDSALAFYRDVLGLEVRNDVRAEGMRWVTVSPVLQEPTDQPNGVRDCAFRDPSGTMLRFAEPRGI
ncbi:MAG TPA: VOC family protein [Actinophytocola sp.]|uniref:VOC family protein n=1 Tax=Actinophytocola sp. TaxID=1872138 RepID=UPI002DDD6B96|nr:VOC family protein [Actinophytocola sp.]HEV2778115.1 VOC family protein [Actinophytocola sp.]